MDNDSEPMLMSEIADELQIEPDRVKDYLEGLGHRIKGDPPLSDSIVMMVRAFVLGI
jgi:predicted transcriptional regulator with HTH domain